MYPRESTWLRRESPDIGTWCRHDALAVVYQSIREPMKNADFAFRSTT